MLAASIDGFLLFWQPSCYELNSVLFLCISCLMALFFVANNFFFFLLLIIIIIIEQLTTYNVM